MEDIQEIGTARQPSGEVTYTSAFLFGTAPDPIIIPANPQKYFELQQVDASLISTDAETPITFARLTIFHASTPIFETFVYIGQSDEKDGGVSIIFDIPFKSPPLTGPLSYTVSGLTQVGDNLLLNLVGTLADVGSYGER
jgi:hypothetical protein